MVGPTCLLAVLVGVVAVSFAPAVATVVNEAAPKPHIVMVIVDDLGYGNTGYNRVEQTPEVVTPNMDALVKEGVHLHRHYVHQMCTPTRSAFQSGRLPIHVQLTLAGPCSEKSGIPRNMTTIASKLKLAGYQTHMMGKWDCGMATPTHTPHGRGFDSGLTYFSHGNWAWSEAEWQGSYNKATSLPACNLPSCAKDLWDTAGPANTINGTKHEEYLFRDRFLEIIDKHNPSVPLFMVYAPKIAHYPLQAPLEYQQKFSFINESHRMVYHSMVNFLDDQLGNLTAALKAKDMWKDTLMVLTADNGGYVKAFQGDCYHGTEAEHGVSCFNGEAGANNFPLRGGKYCHFEGGIRGNSFASGGFLPASVRGTDQDEPIHVADWYATFAGLAGVDPHDHEAEKWGLPPIDSLDMWPLLSGQVQTSPREDILVDRTALVHKTYKLLTGRQAGASWSGPQYPNHTTATDPVYDRSINCNPCLFDVSADPEERNDIAEQNPTLVKFLQERMANISKTIWSGSETELYRDDPECMKTAATRWGGFLGPWLELPN